MLIPQFYDTHVKIVLAPRETSDSLELVLGEARDAVRSVMNNFIDNGKPFKFDTEALVTMHKLDDPSVIIHPIFRKPFGVATELCQTHQDIADKLEGDCIKIVCMG